jgi:hypothetical protein
MPMNQNLECTLDHASECTSHPKVLRKGRSGESAGEIKGEGEEEAEEAQEEGWKKKRRKGERRGEENKTKRQLSSSGPTLFAKTLRSLLLPGHPRLRCQTQRSLVHAASFTTEKLPSLSRYWPAIAISMHSRKGRSGWRRAAEVTLKRHGAVLPDVVCAVEGS